MTNPVDDFADYDSFKLAGVRSPGVCTFPQAPERIEGWEQQIPSGGGGGFTVHKNSPPIEFDVEVYVWIGEDENGAPVDGFADYEKFTKLFKNATKATSVRATSASSSATRAAERARAAVSFAQSVAIDPSASPTDKARAEQAAASAAQAADAAQANARNVLSASKALSWSHPLTDKLDPPVASVVIGKWGMPKPDGVGGGTARIHFEEYRPFVVKPIVTPDSTFVEKPDKNADVKALLHANLQTLDAVRGPRR